MAQQSSRLHRLLTLLDTGSTQATRFTAARQLGDIAKSYPQDLNSLLCKVSQYLRSKNWDTRVAAAHAIGAIAESVKHTSLTDLCTCVETKMSEEGIPGPAEDVVAWPIFHPNFVAGASFRSYDLSKVLEFGALLASGGQEYDIASDNTKNPRERLARQKQNLRRRLGLDVCEQFMDVNDMIRDEDLIVNKLNSPVNGVAPQHNTSRSVRNVQQLVTNMVPSFKSRRPSARELNLLKRKAKINLKDQTKVWSKDGDTDEQHSQEVASPKGFGPDISTSNKVLSDAITDEEGIEDDGDEVWPFHSFVEQLILDMFDPVWEVRHGSVMALREILTHQGASAGVFMSDLNGNFALLSESKDKGNTSTLKRERDIDLNLQVPIEESEMILKRPKLEHSSSQRIDAMISTSSNGAFEASIKVEASELGLPAQQANGELNISSVKVEFQSYLDSVGYLSNEPVDMTEAKSSSEDKDAMGKTDILKNIPENCELMKLVKLARHSWLKNSEFLQDCAIRFLCVLSLDRSGNLCTSIGCCAQVHASQIGSRDIEYLAADAA